jgi:hypothetical protein
MTVPIDEDTPNLEIIIPDSSPDPKQMEKLSSPGEVFQE